MSKVLRLKNAYIQRRKYLVKDFFFFLLNHLKIRFKHHDTSLLNIPKNKDIVLHKDKSRDGQLGLLQTPTWGLKEKLCSCCDSALATGKPLSMYMCPPLPRDCLREELIG